MPTDPLPPDPQYVPIRAVLDVSRQPPQTIYTWIRRGHVRASRDKHGLVLVSFIDIYDRLTHADRGE